MKKNKMLRIASVLLIVTILSTVAISGTFAKYITQYSGNDEARVAKFGLTMTATGDLFKDAYDGTVKAINGDQVVAPGTSNLNEYKVHITGTTEVKTKLSIKLTGNQDIVLPARFGTDSYPDLTTANNLNDTFQTEIDYYPVKFSIKAYGSIETANGIVEFGDAQHPLDFLSGLSLSEFEDALSVGHVPTNSINQMNAHIEGNATDGYYLAFNINAGKTLDVTFVGGWAWAFENNIGTVDFTGPNDNDRTIVPLTSDITVLTDPQARIDFIDKCDTYLGSENPLQTLSYTFEATAVQID